ncbi:hypothetical protein M8C21_023689 [Ambrosia artemisiifolia]|uniref:Uncharacterized protein n=1 Tax=Ambrosia artemisiifolia TaxID=4212 RepID=A0AAD5C6M5_AMBAR|nr:hypothetical protein M8C21_023689 [Ambrosia artemisiifolia]
MMNKEANLEGKRIIYEDLKAGKRWKTLCPIFYNFQNQGSWAKITPAKGISIWQREFVGGRPEASLSSSLALKGKQDRLLNSDTRARLNLSILIETKGVLLEAF